MIKTLYLILYIFTGHPAIGIGEACAWDEPTTQWVCNYSSVKECLSYNDDCIKRRRFGK